MNLEHIKYMLNSDKLNSEIMLDHNGLKPTTTRPTTNTRNRGFPVSTTRPPTPTILHNLLTDDITRVLSFSHFI